MINYAYNLHSFAMTDCFRRKRGVGDGCLCSFQLRQYYSTLLCLSSVNTIICNKVICLFLNFFLIYFRVNFKNNFLVGGPLGCDGTANKSGWMNYASMDLWIKHFIKFVRPSKERPVLLLLDNHSFHMLVNALNIAKENYVHFLSFPAHCSHGLQPLDVSVYGSMKKYV
jgi:hypothetical protein